jgi:hypothetical protein
MSYELFMKDAESVVLGVDVSTMNARPIIRTQVWHCQEEVPDTVHELAGQRCTERRCRGKRQRL